MNFLAWNPRALNKPLRQAGVLSEQANRALIHGRILRGRIALLPAQVDEIWLRHEGSAVHREHGIARCCPPLGVAPDIDNIRDLAEAITKVTRNSGPATFSNRLTTTSVSDTRPNLVCDPAPAQLGDHSRLASIQECGSYQ
jgi:hypothetical protein